MKHKIPLLANYRTHTQFSMGLFNQLQHINHIPFKEVIKEQDAPNRYYDFIF